MKKGGGDADLQKIDEFLEVTMRLEMDRKNKVETFEELGMTDPFKTKESIDTAL